MDALFNPYRPGAGTRPVELAGRGLEIGTFENLLMRLERSSSEKSLMLQGLRGVGKTVLMVEFEGRAKDRGWGVGRTEIRSDTDLRNELSKISREAVLQISKRARREEALMRAASFIRSFSLSASPSGEVSVNLPDLEKLLEEPVGQDIERDVVSLFLELGRAAKENETGIVLMIDEMHLLGKPDLEAICAAAHRAGQEDLPVALIGAGLPELPERLAEAKSYAERLFAFPNLDRLDKDEAEKALRRPAETAISSAPVSFEQRASDLLLERSDRYPYFIQTYGKHAWHCAPDGDHVITLEAAERATALAQEELDRDFFELRYARATKSERRLLSAMAALESEPIKTSEAVDRGGWQGGVASVGPIRQGLIDKGLVYSRGYGLLDFTVPHFGDFLRRKHPQVD